MSNLKKVLALTLVFALVLSMGIQASAFDFTDKGTAPIKAIYQPAVDMMHELNIMAGFEDGSFKPDDGLTRAQYLKMLYVVINRGNDDKAAQYVALQPKAFSDVYSGAWFEGYVKFGTGRNWVGGYPDGTFRPSGNVTGFEALKWSLTALGYDSETEGYTGESWKQNVLNDAMDAGLLLNLVDENMDVTLPRQAAAQLLYNTLFAQMVRYNTTYIPPKMEKGETMAFTYYSLYILRGVVVSNEWASLVGTKDQAGESTIYINAANLPRDTAGNVIGSGLSGGGISNQTVSYTLPYQASLDLLGHEIVVFARYANNYSIKPFDKVYGEFAKTARSKSDWAYANADITTTTADATAIASGAAVNMADFAAYLVNKDNGGLNKSGASVYDYTRWYSNYRFVGYSDGLTFVSDHNIKKGSPIEFIDNDNNGIYDFVVARSYTYSNISAVGTDNKITAYAGQYEGDNFSSRKSLDAKAKADVYGSADLKVDDRVLQFPIIDKNGVVVISETKATLTASRDNGKKAVIDTKEYKQSLLESRSTQMDEVLVGDHFNVEKGYYFWNSAILEGPEVAAVPKQWALVTNSYHPGNSIAGNSKVEVLLENGSKKIYNLTKLRTYVKGDDSDAAITTYATTNATNDHNISRTAGGAPIHENIFLAQVSDDETAITLWDVADAVPQATGGASTKYTKGNSYITLATAFNKNVLNKSVFFIKDGSDYGVYIGRDLPSFTGTAATKVTQLKTYNDEGKLDRLSGQSVAATLITDGARIGNVTNKNFGYILEDPYVTYADGKFMATIKLFNGKDVVTLETILGVKGAAANPYSESSLNSVATGLTANTLKPIDITKDNIIEYGLNADGKISVIVVLGKETAIKDNVANMNGVYNIYEALVSDNVMTVWEKNAAGKYVTKGYARVTDDTKYFEINGDSSRAIGSLKDYGSAFAADKAFKVIFLVKGTVSNTQQDGYNVFSGGEVVRVWVTDRTPVNVIADPIAAVAALAGTGTGLTVKMLKDAGAVDVDSSLLAKYIDALDTDTAFDTAAKLDSTSKIQSMVNKVNTAAAGPIAAIEAQRTPTGVITTAMLTAAGVTATSNVVALQTNYQTAIRAWPVAIGSLTQLQAIVDGVNLAAAQVEANRVLAAYVANAGPQFAASNANPSILTIASVVAATSADYTNTPEITLIEGSVDSGVSYTATTLAATPIAIAAGPTTLTGIDGSVGTTRVRLTIEVTSGIGGQTATATGANTTVVTPA